MEVLAAAAADGHTALPRSLVAAVLSGRDLDPARTVDEAIGTGTVVAVGDLLALADLSAAEERIARVLADLARTGRLEVADVPVWTPVGPADGHLVAAAESLTVDGFVQELAGVPAGSRVVLVGDPGLPRPAGAGQVFADLLSVADALGVPVRESATPARDEPLPALCAAVRAGSLPPLAPDPEHRVVVVPVPDSHTAVHRTRQLVTHSIPRRLGLSGDEVAVVTAMRRGPAGVDALRAAGLPAYGVRESLSRRWPAVVAVLPAEACGLLSRPVVYAMFTRATGHLSVVHGAGPVLARAVRDVPARPRRTRLPALLREYATQAPREVVV